MTGTVRDEGGVTHVAVRLPLEEDPGGPPVIGALCEDTLGNLLDGSFVAWTVDDVDEGLPDCMSCLVRYERLSLPAEAP